MIVVAIVGVLAALAIYGVRKYLLNSKTTEVRSTSGATGKFTSSGYGDLNGDGVTSSFSLSGEVTAGIVYASPNFAEAKPEE